MKKPEYEDRNINQYQLLGNSKIGDKTMLGPSVIVGHPVTASVRKNGEFLPEEGAIIGSNCIIRSGSIIYERAVLGDNIQTGHGVVIREDAHVGSESVVGSYTTIKEGVYIGKGCRLQEAIQVCERAIIGNYVFIGPHVVMTAERYMLGALLAKGDITREEFEQMEKGYWNQPSVIVEDDVRIGSNSILIAGAYLGKGCIVAAGSVISTKVPPGCTIAGNPARIIRRPVEE